MRRKLTETGKKISRLAKKAHALKKRKYICDKCRHEFYGVPVKSKDRFGNTLILCPMCAGAYTDVKES